MPFKEFSQPEPTTSDAPSTVEQPSSTEHELSADERSTLEVVDSAQSNIEMLVDLITSGVLSESQLRAIRTSLAGLDEMVHDELRGFLPPE